MVIANFDNIFNIFPAQNIACRVSGVDDDHASKVDSKIFGVLDSLKNFFRVDAPIFFFIEVVLDHGSAIECK
jgi:hypothetical protein